MLTGWIVIVINNMSNTNEKRQTKPWSEKLKKLKQQPYANMSKKSRRKKV